MKVTQALGRSALLLLLTIAPMSVPTRTRILDGAWDLFLREGFAGTTVTQIEASAGLSAGSGSFYRHFRSKEEVLQAVVDREVDRTNAERQTGPEPEETGGDVRVALALEFERRLGNLRRLHPLMELVARERDHLGASVDHLGELLVARNVSIRSQRLASWMAAGAILTRDAEALAAVITFALTGYHLSVRFFGHPPAGLSEEALITTLVDLVAGV
ncbi:TetR/AcrR family transcriptional regulator [Streptomyces sp. NPDC002845]